jgi:hypothetical protein
MSSPRRRKSATISKLEYAQLQAESSRWDMTNHYGE